MGGNATTDSTYEDVTVTTVIPFCEEFTPREMLNDAIETVENQVGVDTNTIVVEDEEQRGPAWARNVGLEEADTRYVAFLDGDDLWTETKLVEQLQRMDETDAGMCLEGDEHYSTDEFIEGVMKSEIFALTSSILVDTDRTDVRFDESLPRREDHLYMLEVASEVGVCFVQDVFTARKYEDGMSGRVNRSERQVHEFYEIVADRVPEARDLRREYYEAVYVGLGRAKHHDREYRRALECYLKSLEHGLNVDAVGAIGLTMLAVAYWYPLQLSRRLLPVPAPGTPPEGEGS